ncbi:hypothetical protein S245_063022, partial [Arachis hypogaea]
ESTISSGMDCSFVPFIVIDGLIMYDHAITSYFDGFLIVQRSDLDSLLEQNNVTSSAKTIVGSTPLKQNQRHEGSARIIRSILSNKKMRQ